MMVLRWHKIAQEQFRDIFRYYKDVANLSCARKVTQKLKSRACLLKTNPGLGLIEPLLKERSHIYRALIIDHYKLIYYVEGEYVYIALIWDCRQASDILQQIR